MRRDIAVGYLQPKYLLVMWATEPVSRLWGEGLVVKCFPCLFAHGVIVVDGGFGGEAGAEDVLWCSSE